MERLWVGASAPWAASALAALGVAVIGYAARNERSLALGLVLLGLSASASLMTTTRAADPSLRFFAASAACGACSAATIAGIPSFGLALLPAATAWAVALVTTERPPDATETGTRTADTQTAGDARRLMPVKIAVAD